MHHQDAFTVAGNPKTSYFLYVMMATGFLVIFILVVVVVRCSLSFGLFVKQFVRTLYALDFTGHR